MLSLAVAFSMMPAAGGFVFAADGAAFETKTPALVVTGKGVIGNSGYSSESVSKEKSYTMDELKSFSDGIVENQMYSAKKASDPYARNYYKVSGVKLKALLGVADSDDIAADVRVIASDDYEINFVQNKAYVNDGKTETVSIDTKRSYYDFSTEKEVSEVPVVLAWAEFGTDNKKGDAIPELPSDSDALKELKAPKLFCGQVAVDDMNQSLFNKNCNRVIVGTPVTEAAVTVGGKAYTRAELMLMDYAVRSYTYPTQKKGVPGFATDSAKGVPLEKLLAAYADDDVVSFVTVDNWPVENLTVKEIKDGHYMLAYEMKREAPEAEAEETYKGIYDSDKNDPTLNGVIRMYGDDVAPVKMLAEVKVTKKETPKPAPVVTKPGKAKVSVKAGKKKATVSWKSVSGAAGFEVYRSTKKNKGFKKVKTINSGKTLKFVNKKLKGKKTYYFKVRAFKKDAAGKKIYGAFSAVKKVKTRK